MVASKMFGSDKVITNRKHSLGGDDFAEFNRIVPGTYVYLGYSNKDMPETCVAHHNSEFDIDEDCLSVGVALTAGYAIEYLNGRA